jgi:hypothetical protein
MDGDDDLDLAVANHWGHSLSILMNNGDAIFQSPVDYAPGGGGIYPNSVFCANLDEDLDLDIAVANGLTDDVWILMNNGDGSLGPIEYYSAGDAPSSIFCADIDGDADMDLVVANESSNNVSIHENNGSGVFLSAVSFSADQDPRSVFCADLDGDDDLDLAVANFSSNNVSILENLRSSYITGDANGDGAVDAADVIYLVIYLYRNGPPPDPIESGDADCNGVVGAGDIIYLINYLFRGGPPPGC